jgi:hypothetical protein
VRRGRPGALPRAAGTPHARGAVGEQRTLASVGGIHDDRPVPAVDADPDADGLADERPATRLWHVTLNLSGSRAPLPEVRRALEQLAHDHPFLLTSRYAADHAEIRYWEEARDLHDAAAIALRLWGEHKATAKLPPWEIVGLEVIDRETYHQRVAEGYGPPPATPVGVHPY